MFSDIRDDEEVLLLISLGLPFIEKDNRSLELNETLLPSSSFDSAVMAGASSFFGGRVTLGRFFKIFIFRQRTSTTTDARVDISITSFETDKLTNGP